MSMRRWILLTTIVLSVCGAAEAERIKDIVDIKGVRGNPLLGYGLVVGLNGSGDNSAASLRALTNVLRRQNIVLDPADLSSKNIASVMVTAELGPFARRGSLVDVTISAIGDAKSLQGGTLLMTPLIGADSEVYVVAQGPIVLGGFAAGGEASSISKNHVTVGRIPSGGHVEKEELATFVENGELTLQLKNPDFATAARIAEAINELHPKSSHAPDAGAVRIRVPKEFPQTEISGFVRGIGSLQVVVDMPALVVINERTGTIVVGQNVGISTVAISHGSLSIITEEKKSVSQPTPFSSTGATTVTPETKIRAIEEQSLLHVVPRQVSVSELARAINAMGLTPRDLISIFQALRRAGALQAELKII
jgi:flagellar P-ring protein FlgI